LKERKETVNHYTIHSAVRIGHINLKVTDIDCALSFYCDVLGFQVRTRVAHHGGMVVLGTGERDLSLALMPLPSQAASLSSPNSVGLDHVAFRYPSLRELARAYRNLRDCGITLAEAKDYGTNKSLYCSDPDGNGLELYWQASLEAGQLPSQNKLLDLVDLLAELDTPEPR
jgi:catechol 2,3-dioxygenase